MILLGNLFKDRNMGIPMCQLSPYVVTPGGQVDGCAVVCARWSTLVSFTAMSPLTNEVLCSSSDRPHAQ